MSVSAIVQQDATVYRLLYFCNCPTRCDCIPFIIFLQLSNKMRLYTVYYISAIVQQDAAIYSLLYFCNCPTRCDYIQFIIFLQLSNKMRLYTVYYISVNCSTCFGWYLHPSSGAQTTVSTASGTCQTVSATCRYRGEDGTFQLLRYSGR